MTYVPPFRYWLGLVLLSLETRFLEKASHISAGGMGGIAIALNHWSGLPVGLLTLLLKIAILAILWRVSGGRVLFWTLVAAVLSGLFTWWMETVPFTPPPVPISFVAILLFGYFPSSLLLSSGHSSGGFSALAQMLARYGIPVGISLFTLNGLSLLLMDLAYGHLSGILSLVATLASSLATDLWLYLLRRFLPSRSHERSLAQQEAS